jgi:hypothetical protein
MGGYLGSKLFAWMHGRKREKELAAASSWPVITAKLLKPKLVPKDESAEGSNIQTHQVEVPFYFSNEAGYFGGHVRSAAVSPSEGERLLRQIVEGAPVQVRYNPANPDETHALAEDNQGTLPFTVWSM